MSGARTHTDIEEVGHRAHLYAELAGRIEANFNDVRLTFDELGLNLRELSHYSATLDETPFPKGTRTRAHPLHTPIPLRSHVLTCRGAAVGWWVVGGPQPCPSGR
jgi:hypothetical protein